MTPEAINKKCAEWAGRSAKFMSVNGITYDQHCEPFPKDYFRTNAAMDLLGVLVERGYGVSMSTVHKVPEHLPQLLPPGWMVCVELDGLPVVDALGPTIPAAICNAILKLIEREGR